ncbi:MAG: YlmH/Sll1252 family protein [Eubacteriales bacterium]|nr:YlmH/Sll1252 family protein [Eubacteriales bacterium]
MRQEDQAFRKRIEELAEKSYRNSQYLFTDFLDESEAALLRELAGQAGNEGNGSKRRQTERQGGDPADGNGMQGMPEMAGANEASEDALTGEENSVLWLGGGRFACGVSLCGGHAEADRVMARFGSEEAFGYVEAFPIVCLKAEPLLKKFADTLTHRDFLGAVLNLGLERKVIGDILVDEENACGYLFCEAQIAEFLRENLDKVKHTNVKCSVTERIPENLGTKTERLEFQIASERIDAVAAQFCRVSRSESLELLRAQRVSVNGRVVENPTHQPAAGDRISIRGYGKMKYLGTTYVTKKGKCNVAVEKYV